MKTILPIIFAGALALMLCGCVNVSVDTIRNDPLVYAPSPIPVATDAINIENGDFSPKIIDIARSTTVTFTNRDATRHLIVSDPHPAHNELPDLYSQWLVENESYKYQFIKSGTFGVHLEDNPSVSAKIIVR